MARQKPGGLFGLMQAGIAAATAEAMRELREDVAGEYGDRHLLSHIARAGELYHSRRAEGLAQEHGYDYQPGQQRQQPPRQRPPLPEREPTPDEYWQAGQEARTAGDHEAAGQLYTAAARQGHVRSMLALATWHEEGEHVPQNHLKAALWYQKAIDAGDRQVAPRRLDDLGQRFQRGEEGAPKDVATAFQIYLVAAEAGNRHAQFAAAWYLRRGKAGITEQDRDEARRLFRLSARQGYADAERELAEMDAEDRGRIGGQSRPAAHNAGGMSRAQALEIIGLEEGAAAGAMKAAWVRLMQANHPDKGGSTYFAKQLNAARETLGF